MIWSHQKSARSDSVWAWIGRRCCLWSQTRWTRQRAWSAGGGLSAACEGGISDGSFALLSWPRAAVAKPASSPTRAVNTTTREDKKTPEGNGQDRWYLDLEKQRRLKFGGVTKGKSAALAGSSPRSIRESKWSVIVMSSILEGVVILMALSSFRSFRSLRFTSVPEPLPLPVLPLSERSL